MKPSQLLLWGLIALVLLGSFSPPDKPLTTVSECFTGRWGNDFILCGFENTGRPGVGNLQKRLEEELKLYFTGGNQGEFRFYDCQNKRPFEPGIKFSYVATRDSFYITWLGSERDVFLASATFQFRTAFSYECQGDKLVIKDLMVNTSYNKATYFLRRPLDAPQFAEPADGSSLSSNVLRASGMAEPSSRITVFLDGNPIGTTQANIEGNWTFGPWEGVGPGQHTLWTTVTDRAGFLSATSSPRTITYCPPLTITQQPQNQQRCQGGEVAFEVGALGGGIGYQWQINRGDGFQSLADSPTVQGSQSPRLVLTALPGEYNGAQFRCLLNQQGCLALSQQAVLTVNSGPSFSATVRSARCHESADGTIEIAANGQGPFQYALNNAPTQASPTFAGLKAGTYALRVDDGRGCQASATAMVGQPEPIRFSTRSTPVACAGPQSGKIQVFASGGTGAFQYQLNGGTFTDSGTFSGLGVGNYPVLIHDGAGCQVQTTVAVNRVDTLKMTLSVTSATSCTTTDGVIAVGSTGGVGVKEAKLDELPFTTTLRFLNLRTGSYQVTLRDSLGCQVQRRVEVTTTRTLSASLDQLRDVTCEEGRDGAAAVLITTGRAPYTYAWSSGGTTASVTGLASGAFSVKVTDSDGCSQTLTGSLKILNPLPPAPTITLTASGLQASGGQGQYQWYTGTPPVGSPLAGATAATLVPLSGGSYYITVQAATGCVSKPSQPFLYVLTALEPQRVLHVELAPNPAQHHTELLLEATEPEILEVSMSTASGHVLKKWTLQAGARPQRLSVNLSGLPSGMYIISVKGKAGSSVQKLLVQ